MDHNLQHKLFHFETDPPERVWNEIELTLDTSTQPSFAQKLYAFEKVPDEWVWTRISEKLGTAEPSKRATPIHRYKRPLTYSVAAIGFLVIILSVSLLFSNNKHITKAVTKPTLSVTKQAIIPQTPLNSNYEKADTSTNGNIAETVAGHHSPVNFSKKIVSARIDFLALTNAATSLEHFFQKKIHPSSVIPDSAQDDYLIYSDTDGNAVRISKSLFDRYNCAQRDSSCKEHLRQLQQHIASSILPDDFSGVIEILNKIRENQ